MEKIIEHLKKIDKSSPIPMYYQIKQILIDLIEAGELKPEDALPPEIQICKMCDISRTTIRQAFTELVHEGYLYSEKGKGRFVAYPKIEARFLNELQSFDEEMEKKNLVPSTKLLSKQIIRGLPAINQGLNLDKDAELICLERLRFANNNPIVYLQTYFPYEPYKGILEEDFEKNSFYYLMERKFNVKVVRVVRELEAINATAEIAKLLDMEKNAAIFYSRTIGYTDDNLPVELSRAFYRGDSNKFSVELVKS